MKIVIASDLHGSAYYADKVREAFEREEGELLGYIQPWTAQSDIQGLCADAGRKDTQRIKRQAFGDKG